MLQYLKWIPLVYRLAHLFPDAKEIFEKGRPLVQLAIKLWPELKPPLLRIINDPAVHELREQIQLGKLKVGLYNVRWLQQGLKESGVAPELVVDGEYGPATTAAVKRFQVMQGLEPDGWAGPVTSAALHIYLHKQKTGGR